MAAKYDERQQQVRGTGYKYAFFLGVALNFVLGFLPLFYGKPLFASQMDMALTATIIPMTFLVAYFVLNDAYYDMRDVKSLPVIALVWGFVGISNLSQVFSPYSQIWEKGQFSEGVTSLLMAIFCFTLTFTSLYKIITNREDYSFKEFLRPRNLVLGTVVLAIIIAGLIINVPLGERVSNLLFGFFISLTLAIGGWIMSRPNYIRTNLQPKWTKYLGYFFFLIGTIWFGYLTVYYLFGFHNYLWGN